MTGALLVVCEAPADFQIAADLADRVIKASIGSKALSASLTWHESEPGRTHIRGLARASAASPERPMRPRQTRRCSSRPSSPRQPDLSGCS